MSSFPEGIVACASALDAQVIQRAVERYVEACTFLQWMIAGTLLDGETPPTVVSELANQWPDFLTMRTTHAPDRVDLVQDFESWTNGHFPGHTESWWPTVERRTKTDPRVRGAYDLAHGASRDGSPLRYSDYAGWKERAWAAGPSTATSKPPALPTMPLPARVDEHYHCGSDSTIQGIREVISLNTFATSEDSPWPTAPLNRGNSQGVVELRPVILDEQPIIPAEELGSWQHAMWHQREELSDLDVDTLDALNAIWLSQAESENHSAVATVDMILAMRSLQPKKGGRGTRGGYEKEQRHETMLTLGHLQNVWVTMAAIRGYEMQPSGKRKRVTRVMQSRAFVITDRTGQLRFDGYIDVDAFMFRPGDVIAHVLFGPGRQTALMSAKALQFNPYTQAWEKRLTRYLSWQWRCRARQGNYDQPFKISTLLSAVGHSPEMRPNRTRERLETALDTLQVEGVLTGWQYDRWDENAAGKKGWFATWNNATLRVNPPDIIRTQYASLEQSTATRTSWSLPSFVGERLENRRRQLGMSQAAAAARFGISQSYWSLIVKGKKDVTTLSTSVRGKLEAWLEGAD